MPIETVTRTAVKKGLITFKVNITPRLGVFNAIVYACPRGADPIPDETIVNAVQQGTLNGLGAQSIPVYSGQTGTVYAPKSELGYQWVDLFLCELNSDNEVLTNEKQLTCFYGNCIIGWKMERYELSDQYDAVSITLYNQSGFDFPADSIAYRVGTHVMKVPGELRRGVRKEYPPFSVRCGEAVRMEPLEGGYPIEFRNLTD